MTGVTFHIRLDDAAARAELDRLAERDLTPLMAQIGLALETSARARIEKTNLAPDGKPWTPSRGAQKRGSPTLFDRGRLAASLTHRAEPREVAVGTNLDYAAIHQFGGEVERAARTQTTYWRYNAATGSLKGFVPRRRANLARDHHVGATTAVYPARPYLGISAEDEERIRGLVARWLEGVAR